MTVTSVPRSRWADQAQPGELAFHKQNGHYRGDDAKWNARNAEILTEAGFAPGDFAGQRILDVGAGSRLRSTFFEDALIYALEPLADRFRRIPWCDLDAAAVVVAEPVETYIDGWRGFFPFIMSVNALDHCYDFPRAVSNIAAYLAPGGRVWLRFDCRTRPNKLHPLVLDEHTARAAFAAAGLTVDTLGVAESFGKGGGFSLSVHLRGAS